MNGMGRDMVGTNNTLACVLHIIVVDTPLDDS